MYDTNGAPYHRHCPQEWRQELCATQQAQTRSRFVAVGAASRLATGAVYDTTSTPCHRYCTQGGARSCKRRIRNTNHPLRTTQQAQYRSCVVTIDAAIKLVPGSAAAASSHRSSPHRRWVPLIALVHPLQILRSMIHTVTCLGELTRGADTTVWHATNKQRQKTVLD